MKKWNLNLIALAFLFAVILPSAQGQACDCPAESNQLTNPHFNLGDTGFSSDLTWSNTCGNTEYLIANEGRDKCPSSDWYDDTWDNTLGTSDGRYMIIDGPNDLDQTQIWQIWYNSVVVEVGATYQFSFAALPRISNHDTPVPNLAYYVNGINISGDFDLADQLDWIEYCFSWTADYSGPAVIEIRQNPITAGYGFDYGLDDMYFGKCQAVCGAEADFDWQLDLANCEISLTNLSTAGNGNTIVGYQWDFGNGTTSTETTPEPLFGAGGFYDVCLTVYSITEDGECCIDTQCKVVQVHCNPAPCAANLRNIFYAIYQGDGCDVQFAASADPNRPVFAYLWDFGDGSTGTGQYPSHSYATGGTYTVCVTMVLQDGENCCTETFCKPIKINCHHIHHSQVGDADAYEVNDKSNPVDLRISPNPTDDIIQLEFETDQAQDFELLIFDLQGKQLQSLNGHSTAGQNQRIMTTNALPAGSYIVSLVLSDKLLTKKLIVQ